MGKGLLGVFGLEYICKRRAPLFVHGVGNRFVLPYDTNYSTEYNAGELAILPIYPINIHIFQEVVFYQIPG